MKNVIYKNKKIFYAIVFALVFCTVFFAVQDVVLVANASNGLSFDNTNVLDDLENSTIDGKKFDLSDFPFDDKKETSVLAFSEYCYTYYPSKQDQYGLYVYVYNPSGKAINVNSNRNMLQMAYGGNDSYGKYPLKFLNYSTKVGYEGLFYKFKLDISSSKRKNILDTLSQNMRIYKVSGIELAYGNNVTEFTVAQIFTYSGFAEGYGPELSTGDTLTCSVTSIDEFLQLSVKSTYYRPNGTNGGKYVRDTLHSVYFSVPNEIIKKYGEMSAVHARWLNVKTNPIFVTGNSSVYNEVSQYIGQYVDGGNYHLIKDANANTSLKYSLIASKYIESANFNNVGRSSSYMSYNINRKYTSDSDVTLNYLQYCFPVDKMDKTDRADTFIVNAESLIGDKKKNVKGYFQEYTEKYGGTLVNDRFSSALFETVADEFTDVTIESSDTFTLTDEIITQDLWQKFIGGGYHVTGTNTYTLNAIKRVEDDDFKTVPSETCSNLFIDESDYTEFLTFYNEAKMKQETVYLFRYYQSDYTHYEVAEYKRTTDGALIEGFDYEFIDTNAYFMQMWVQLDFDVIDVSFAKDGKTVIVPNVMSPIDISADGGTTLFPNSDDDGLPDWVKWLFIVLGLILLLVVLAPILPYILNAIVWVVSLPFKIIGRIGKSFKNYRDKQKHKGDGVTQEDVEEKAKNTRQKLKQKLRG